MYSPPARGLLIHCWCSSAEGRAGVECGWKPAGRRQVASAPPGRHARFQCHEVPTSFSSTSTNVTLYVKLCNVISLGRTCHPHPRTAGRHVRTSGRVRMAPPGSPQSTHSRGLRPLPPTPRKRRHRNVSWDAPQTVLKSAWGPVLDAESAVGDLSGPLKVLPRSLPVPPCHF